MKFFLANDIPNKAIVYYTMQLIALNKQETFEYTSSKDDNTCVTIGMEGEGEIRLSSNFFQLLFANVTDANEHLSENGYIILSDGSIDYLSTIFYYVNCIQELSSTNLDKYGRFDYNESIQFKNGNITVNVVQQLIDELCLRVDSLRGLASKKRKTSFYLTHDIDYLYKAKNEDGNFLLRRREFRAILKLLWNHYFGNPDWYNIHQIVEMEKKWGGVATFFWLPIMDQFNSDYNIKSKSVQDLIGFVRSSGFDNGLHKAVADSSFETEIKLIGESIKASRFHFLKFKVDDFQVIEESGLKIDSSLCFSGEIGMRNNYGLPFMPFSLKLNRTLNFVEVPLNIMDRTLYNKNISTDKVRIHFFDYINSNLDNSVITINWHNNFFSQHSYNGYSSIYEDTLQMIRELNLKTMTVDELITEFYKPELYRIPDHIV